MPGALTPVQIDVEAQRGTYVEPNVSMVHTIGSEKSFGKRRGGASGQSLSTA